ncbi:hypothetical protein O181_021699 [Austropuccinia psidii MF-1]|uniref:Uncharacterized protein n=1 Tax=Austropuccinia psidii MF-1 TaxID=1389203 RepID=A0A9Q3CDH3_9BASI|nr:hypothetical protein [Austropuccinia psidii MF-1]
MASQSTQSQQLSGSTTTPPSSTPLNYPSSSKRKQPPSELAPSTSVSWFGLAFQLPSVIKKEFNDFVRSVRGGSANNLSTINHLNVGRNVFRTYTGRSKRTHSRLSQSTSGITPTARLSASHSSKMWASSRTNAKLSQLDQEPLPISDVLERPSPPKKLKFLPALAETSKPSGLFEEELNLPIESIMFMNQSTFNNSSVTSFSSSENLHLRSPNSSSYMNPHLEMKCATVPQIIPQVDSLQQTGHTKSDDVEMEEILSTRGKNVAPMVSQSHPFPSGSNSVLFPNSRAFAGCNSSNSSLNTDVPFSTNSSLIYPPHSNTTSSASITSVNSSGHEGLNSTRNLRLDSVGSTASPRIRHTKLLGSPRSSLRPHTLSASSFSSTSSFGAPVGLSRRTLRTRPHGILSHTLRGANSSLNNLAPHAQPWKQLDEDESECLNNDNGQDIQDTSNNKSSNLDVSNTYRAKVPLAEIIGRPSNASVSPPSFQSRYHLVHEPYELNASPSLASIASSIMESHPSNYNKPLPPFESSPSVEPTAQLEGIPNRPCNESAEGSSFSITDTSSSLNTLRSQLSSRMNLCANSSSEPCSKTSVENLSHSNHDSDIAMAADEDSRDDSYEFLELEEADTYKSESPRKRKRKTLRSDINLFKWQGIAAIEQSSHKLVELIPHQPKTKPKVKVMQKFGLGRSQNRRDELITQPGLKASLTVEEGLSSPTKKIRVLEEEIARLRQELEDERIKHAIGSVRRSKASRSLSRSARFSSETPRVTFSPQSAFSSSSPAPAPRSRRILGSLNNTQPPPRNKKLSDSPILLKRPCEGALVGGSPFIVSRVYGQGPEVMGEHTPTQADKWLQKQKLASNNGSKFPGLAHDLFGAKSSKGLSSTNIAFSAGARRSLQTIRKSGWMSDHILDEDLFGTIKASRRSSLQPLSKSQRPSATDPHLSPFKNMFRNSVGVFQRTPIPIQTKRQKFTNDGQLPDMTSFLNELKSSGKNKLRKTPASRKLYGAQYSISSPRSERGLQGTSRNSRILDDRNANILNFVLEQNFGHPAEVNAKPFGASAASRTSTVSGKTTHTACSTNTTESHHPPNKIVRFESLENTVQQTSFGPPKELNTTAERSHSPLFCTIYPSGQPSQMNTANAPKVSAVQVILGEAISTPQKKASQSSSSGVDPQTTPRATGPCKVAIQKDFTMDELIDQVNGLKQNRKLSSEKAGNGTLQFESTNRTRQLIHEMGFEYNGENSTEKTASHTIASGGSHPSTTPAKAVTNSQSIFQEMFPKRSSPVLSNMNKGRPKSQISPVRRLASLGLISPKRPSSIGGGLVSILENSACTKEVDCGLGNKCGSQANLRINEKRVRIYENKEITDQSDTGTIACRRHSMPVISRGSSLTNFTKIEEETMNIEEKERNLNKAVGFGVPVDIVPSSSASDWVLVKSDSKTHGDGEPNLRRWSLRTSAILAAHPKIV